MKDCNQCGKCCIKYGDGGLSASPEDIENWAIFNPQIHQYVKNNEIWFSPDDGRLLSYCPFLEEIPSAVAGAVKYGCSAYADRPEDCRFYPTTVSEMVRDECEMIESVDLTDTKRAQQRLDRLMSDSRPPCG